MKSVVNKIRAFSTHTSFRYEGKTVIVTGGSRGIGAGIVTAFVRNGANVVYNGLDIHREAGEKLQHELNSLKIGTASFVSCDVTDSSSVDKLVSNVVQKYGRLDCLGKSIIRKIFQKIHLS